MMDTFQVTTDWLRARAMASPEGLALLIDSRPWRFGELDSLASRFAGYLAGVGVRPGDHVATLLPNSLTAVLSVFALVRLGAVLVPLNTRLTAEEIAWQVERADATRLLADETLANRVTVAVPAHSLPGGAAELAGWLNDCQPLSPEREAPPPFDATQAIVFTSGTTGRPKGAMIRFANHFWSAAASAFRLGVQPGDRWLACLPLYHVGGLAVLFRSCLYGTTVVLHNGFDVTAVRESLRGEGVTVVSLVPTMLNRLLRDGWRGADSPALRLVLLGGAAAAPALLQEAAEAGVPVATTYGLTEAASQVATLPPEGARDKPGSAGRPLLFTQIRILDDSGAPLPVRAPGEIAVTGPTIMAGYYRDDAATRIAIRNDWLLTGDLGYVDDDGDLWILDRRSDLIVSGGENVYPAEVERVLRAHPAVALACVVGLPHPDWGQQVAAVVVLTDLGAATAEELIDHCRARLAGYKRPRRIFFADALPQTASGKVQRRAMIEQLLAQEASV